MEEGRSAENTERELRPGRMRESRFPEREVGKAMMEEEEATTKNCWMEVGFGSPGACLAGSKPFHRPDGGAGLMFKLDVGGEQLATVNETTF